MESQVTENESSVGNATLGAIAIGLCLAWWNIFHDEGFLYFQALDRQMVSCVIGYAGVMAVSLLFIALNKIQKTSTLPLTYLATAQLISLAAFYLSIKLGVDPIIILCQFVVSMLTFAGVFSLLSLFTSMEFPRLPQLIAYGLLAYGTAEGFFWLTTQIFPFLEVRFGTHLVILAGFVGCTWRVLRNKQERLTIGFFEKLDTEKFRLPPQLIVTLGVYWFIFGTTHALDSGVVPVSHDKLLPCYIGTIAAGILFAVVFGRLQPRENLWPLMRSCIFPLAALSFLLLSFANTGLTFLSVSFAQCAMDAYLAFFALACFVVARKIQRSFLLVVSMGAVLSVPFLIVGIVSCVILKSTVILTPQLYNVLSVIAFVLLVAGTFWLGNDRQISLVWGLEEKLSPRKFEDGVIAERCAKSAERFGLTKREAEILVFLAHGQNAPTIADDQVISVNTVRTHIARIHRKMGVSNQRELEKKLAEEQ